MIDWNYIFENICCDTPYKYPKIVWIITMTLRVAVCDALWCNAFVLSEAAELATSIDLQSNGSLAPVHFEGNTLLITFHRFPMCSKQSHIAREQHCSLSAYTQFVRFDYKATFDALLVQLCYRLLPGWSTRSVTCQWPITGSFITTALKVVQHYLCL